MPSPLSADGVDLSPLLTGGTAVRDAAYIEGAGAAWDALRTTQHKYAEYATGGRALYDLSIDPFEMQNRASDPGHDGAGRSAGDVEALTPQARRGTGCAPAP